MNQSGHENPDFDVCIDMEVLVKSAETRMYLAKEEHYRLAGKTRG